MRGEAALWIRPKVDEVSLLTGALKFVWFVTLKNSKRSSNLWLSRILKSRVRFVSRSKNLGARSELYPALPKVPGSFRTNAFGLIHTSVFRSFT